MTPPESTTSTSATGTPRISVVMPVYNSERLLGECLAALRASAFKDFEIVVVDDSSTDKSREIAATHGARVVPSGGRLGPGRARRTRRRHLPSHVDLNAARRLACAPNRGCHFARDIAQIFS